jgi:dihydrofolate reductase
MAGRIIYSFMVSVDGYIASTRPGEIGLPIPEDALHSHFNEMQRNTALNLYGRNMYEVMRYWDTPPAESSEVELDFARAWQETPKVVFSSTLERVGPNVRLVQDTTRVEEIVRELKAETDGDIQVNGARLAASLIRLGLVDEFLYYVMPVVLGSGKPYFADGLRLELDALGTAPLPQGCTLLRFRPRSRASMQQN